MDSGRLAQLVEQLTLNQRVVGSSPASPIAFSPLSTNDKEAYLLTVFVSCEHIRWKMKKFLLSLPLMFLGLGCATRYNVGVNGFSATGTTLKIPQVSSIYTVKDSNAPNPIFEREVATKIQKLVNSKGYAVGAENKANYYLLFEYGIDSGQTVFSRAAVHHPGGRATATSFGLSWSHIDTPGYTTYVPYPRTVYTCWLVLKLTDGNSYRSSQKTEPLWIGEITSTGPSSDLREVINYMLIPAFEHFGENTGKRLNKVVSEGDERVNVLKEH